MKDKNRTLVIVPTYNERDNIEALINAVFNQLPSADILVVDDHSPDGTGDFVESLRQHETRLHCLHRTGKLGLGSAYLDGFRWGLERQYDYLFEMDADFSHDPSYLPTLLMHAEKGADLVLGSRYVNGGGTENWGWLRQLISRGGNVYARFILGVSIKDMTGGFKCFRRKVLETINLDGIHADGYAFQIELTYRTLRKGFRVEEVPIIFPDRKVGQSKMSKKIFIEALWRVWQFRFD